MQLLIIQPIRNSCFADTRLYFQLAVAGDGLIDIYFAALFGDYKRPEQRRGAGKIFIDSGVGLLIV